MLEKNMKSIIRPILLFATLVTAAFTVQAQPSMYVEGTHYTVLPEQGRTVDPNKIEVMEVFWYGCGHCYAFEPLIDSWKGNQIGRAHV